MSDIETPADELKREEEAAATADHTANEDVTEQAEPATDESAEQPELPEGANLLQMLIEAQKEAQANEEGWQRARAEFSNYKKRIERERAELFQRAALDTLQALLPVIDDFDRAFESVPETLADDPWIDGVAMIQRKFANVLERYQVEAIDPTGAPFDPNLHQAIGAEASDDVESGCVIETLQKGYRAGDTVLRLALVKVAS
ncbi:MAG: nucleotide exchange factor GrpE [Chloroflexi bacterium]|nr:nucleotide exchange factor GrpE [Chloroflexota bacterium]